jgi:glycine cleavage system aminomethyltransferase T
VVVCTLRCVSLTAGSRRDPQAFDLVLRRAGAVMASRDGRPVALNFGSAAAELAVCVRAVGLVDRSEECKLVLEAPPTELSGLMTRLAGGAVWPGGVRSTGDAWCCREAADRAFVLCGPPSGSRLLERLQDDAACDLRARDVSDDLVAMGVLGRNAGEVLNALGVYGASGDPRRARPFARGWVGDIPAWWLLQSDRVAVALVGREDAGAAWQVIERAGRPFGISCVGSEAASRYGLVERRAFTELSYV